MEPRRRRYGSRRCRCSPQDCADGCSSKRVNEGLCVAGFRCRWCGGENSSREQHLVKDAYTLSLTYVGVVAHVRGRTAALVCRIPSLLPNGAGCSVVANSVFACPDYWGCGATFTLSCVVGGLAGRSQEDCVISHMTDIRRGVCGRYRIAVEKRYVVRRSIVRFGAPRPVASVHGGCGGPAPRYAAAIRYLATYGR